MHDEQFRNLRPADLPRGSEAAFTPAQDAGAAEPPLISAVIPVYRSEHTLPELHRQLSEALARVSDRYEIIFVEDCGPDDSWNTIESIAAQDPKVRGIKLSRNFGQHAATICGISKASGYWIVTLDDDLEQSPSHIPAMFNKAHEGYALVYGIYEGRSHGMWRNLTSGIARWLFRMAIPSLNFEYTSFRLISRSVASKLVEFDSPFPFVDGYLSWLTNSYATVVVPHGQRAHGTSNYNFRKLMTHTINIFVTFSDMPLRVASWIGLGASVVGMGWLAIILLRSLFGGITVSGYASVMAGIILFGGIQLLILGIFGEYLGRMNFKSSRKPLYLVAIDTGAK
jgi:undecaprenyl-phosphate 4-deoxy-4-formamido-L-arabinose transferase